MRNVELLLLWLVATLLAGCRTAPVERTAETARWRSEMQQRLAELKLDLTRPLTVEQCVDIAQRSSLALRTRQLQLSLQDEQVRLSLAGGLPKLDLAFTQTRRSNPAISSFGGMQVEMQDRELKGLGVTGVLPILDWGTTYYAYQIAKDRRRQERLTVARARQLLTRDVQVAYAQLAAAQRQERLARVGVLAATQLLKVARSLEREGLDSHAATADIEAGLAQVAQAWTALRRGVEQAHLSLTQTLSLPAGLELRIVDDLPPARPLPGRDDVAAFEDRALQLRPELLAQDLQRHIAASTVRQEITRFVPHLDLTGGYAWTSQSGLVNPAWFTGGIQVTDSLLNGGRNWWGLRLARKGTKVEAERTLLLSLGIVYEVDFGLLRLYTANDAVLARQAMVTARTEALRLTVSRYRQGMESGTEAIRSLAELYLQRLQLDRDQTEYQVAWHELDTAAPPSPPGMPAPVPPGPAAAPAFVPGPPLDSYTQVLASALAIDWQQFPEVAEMLRKEGINLDKP